MYKNLYMTHFGKIQKRGRYYPALKTLQLDKWLAQHFPNRPRQGFGILKIAL